MDKDDKDYKQLEAEINLKLLQDGYKSLEEAKADIKKKNEDADRILSHAKQEYQTVAKERETLEQDKQKVIAAYAKVKDTEKAVNARLEEAIKLEKARQTEMKNGKDFEEDLLSLIEYHRGTIVPCLNIIKTINKTLNNWLETLEQNGHDFSPLTNFLHKKAMMLDKYIQTENKRTPEELFGEEKPKENQKLSQYPIDNTL